MIELPIINKSSYKKALTNKALCSINILNSKPVNNDELVLCVEKNNLLDMLDEKTKNSTYARSLIEASLDPLVTINAAGKITDVNQASIKVTGVKRDKLIGTNFSNYFTEPIKAQQGYKKAFEKGFVADYPLTIKHINGKLTDVLYNASVYKNSSGKVIGVFAAARDVTAQKILSCYSLSLIEASLDPLFTISSRGKIKDINDASTVMTQTKKNLLIGSNFIDYFTDRDKAKQAYKEVFKNGFIKDYPLTIKDAALTPTLFNGAVYKDDRGNVLGAVVVARVITEQRRFEEELKQAKNFAENATMMAQDAVKAKQQFLSNMSHEIRTPMNAIVGFTKVLLKTELTDKQSEYLKAIKMSGDALIVLINDILDLAKVDAGKMSFEKTSFNISKSIKAIIHLYEAKIQEKNVALITIIDPKLPQLVVGDSIRLHQIILNLISNAIKFTAKGSITIEVKLLKETEKDIEVQFLVHDTGIGISTTKINNIFENFQQATSSTSRLFGGTGLGLAIVKNLVEAQGGSIHVVSTLKKGSTFSFTLPFKKTTVQLFESDLPPSTYKLNKQVKILVAEDMPLNQLLIKTLLDEFGYKHDIVANGKLAIEKLQTTTYDIILMDLQMPELNGFDTTIYIRKTLQLKLPIIALTADVTTVDVTTCKAVGMDDYIAKPIDEKLLFAKINHHLNKQIIKKKTPVETATVNLSYLKKVTRNNKAKMINLITLYLQQTPAILNEMNIGIKQNNHSLIASSIHKIIPSFSIMGFNGKYEKIAQKINQLKTTDTDNSFVKPGCKLITTACNKAKKELTLHLADLKK